jgi:hypothetical protein
MSVLLQIIIKFLLLLPESGDKLFRSDGAHLLLLRGDRIEQVREAREERLLRSFVLCLVLKHLLPERLAKVERLQHRIAIARVSELKCTIKYDHHSWSSV